ncbi:hypothetical protein HD554DRAFT_2041451 [Boletus coccyginus]|nr:hypothetical protein HD554DRAFT_2041451 [Boletus coccyginus]
MDTITVVCGIYGLGVQGIFILELSGTDTVTTLRKAIKDELPIKLRDVETPDLELYVIPSPDDAHIEDELKHLELKGRPQLLPWHTLSSLNLSDKLVIVNPSTRASDDTEGRDMLQWVQHARYAPSTMGVTQYRELQASVEDRLLDRRLPDDNVPPIAPVYQPLGKEGEAFNPYDSSTPDLAKERNHSGLMITKEDDMQNLAATLRQIKLI